jgi:parallel beta-helix repeat protein
MERAGIVLGVVAVVAMSAFLSHAATGSGASGRSETFFVSTQGNDQWSGRFPSANAGGTDGPFATPSRAQEAVRRVAGSNGAGPIRVIVRGGKYFLSRTLVLDERDSGTRAAPIAWIAYAGEQPVFSGGTRVIRWRPYQEKILQTDLAEICGGAPHDLFFNGTRQTRARIPDRDPANPLYGGWAFMQGAAGPDALKYPEGLFAGRIAKPSQGEVTFFVGPAGGWGSQTLPITSIDYDRRIIHTRHHDGEHPLLGFTRNSRFIVENLLEALTEPGEWYADAEAGKLYFWPPVDFDGAAESVVPTLPTLLTMVRAKWITISGLTFTETSATGLDGFHCEDSQHIRILGNRFLGLGSRALALMGRTRPCRDVLVQGNEIAHAGRCGIYVGGNARDCQILDNQIHHCGVFDKYSAGIEFPFYGGTSQDVGPQAFTDGILIAHNHLHDLPRDGIQLGANPYGRNVVEYNRVERAALETIDAGALRCHRVISHLAGLANLPNMAGHVFRHNFVADTRGCGVENGAIITPYPWPTFGIYLDEGSSHCRVYGNIVLRSGVGVIINPGEFNTIENNVLAGNAVGICFQAASPFDQLKHSLGGNRFVRNIICVRQPERVAFSLRDWTATTIGESDFNLFWSPIGGAVLQTQAGRGAPQVSRSLADWQQLGYDLHSRAADPQFPDPCRDNYQLPPTSPARELGFAAIDIVAIGPRRAWKPERPFVGD